MVITRERLLARDVEVARGRLDPSMVLNLTGYPGGGSIGQDRSLSRNNGTIIGAVWTRLPSGLWCLSFDGVDDFINLGNPVSLEAMNNGTILMWFMPTADIAYTAEKAFIDKGNTYIGFGYQITPARQTFTLYDGATHNLNLSARTWAAGTWYHLGLRWGTLGQFIFVNGEIDAQDLSSTGGYSATATNWNLGRNANNKWYANIMIGQTSAYNRALSALEMSNYYQNEKHLFGV